MSIRIAIVEDVHQIRKNLITRFSFFDDIEILFDASNGIECIQKLQNYEDSELPDILLMDIEMPGLNGIETTAKVKKNYPDIDIMMQTVFEDRDNLFKSIQAGASGYLLKDDPIEKYVDALRDMKEGGAPVSPAMAQKLLDHMRLHAGAPKGGKEDFDLTSRELDILQCVVDDLTEAQIADQLYISPHTVRTHIKNVYKKLHVHSRASVVRVALTKGLLS